MLNRELLEIVLTSSHEPKGSFSIAFSALAALLGLVMDIQSIRYLPKCFPDARSVLEDFSQHALHKAG
jgi:hypothetical protein